MSEENKQAAAQEGQVAAEAKAAIPISEPSTIHRKIPRAVFIEDIEAWVDKYGEEDLFAQMQQLHQKYKFMEG